MDVVTYLLGAGASAQCLPVVKDLSSRIRTISQQLKNELNNFKFISHINLGDKQYGENQLITQIYQDLDWMANECDKHSSIDTFAKKLYILKKDHDYLRLKTILSIYFTLEQKRNAPDLRYDNFWASILEEKNKFPQNLRIASWNYDFQLEQSYLNFSDHETLIESYNSLNIRSYCDPHRAKDADNFAIYKLNGSATINDKNQNIAFFTENISDDNTFYKNLLYRYALLVSDPSYQRNLSFAWEHNLNDIYFKELKQSLNNTRTLVVVGYSFPYFNRKIDKYLIECMPYLEKVYFQSPEAVNLKERFSAVSNKIKNENLLLRVDLEQFTFPNEL